jgi:hypothetical protein
MPFGADGAVRQPGIRTGRWLNPRTNADRMRVGLPTTSITLKRRRISSQRIFNCSSASRLPTQRWMPKPKDRCWRGRSRSTMNRFGSARPYPLPPLWSNVDVAQAQLPPQSPSMPGTPLSVAARTSVVPTGTSTVFAPPENPMKVTLAMQTLGVISRRAACPVRPARHTVRA